MTEIKREYIWQRPKRHALTVEEHNVFISYVAKSKVYRHWMLLFTALLGTGQRLGEIMGHSDIGTTMNIYAEVTEKKKQESFRSLEGKIKIC